MFRVSLRGSSVLGCKWCGFLRFRARVVGYGFHSSVITCYSVLGATVEGSESRVLQGLTGKYNISMLCSAVPYREVQH